MLLGLDFIFAYYSILLCSPIMPIMLSKLTLLFSNYANKIFSTQTKYLIFYACACSERRPVHNCNVLMRRRVQG